MDSNCPECGLDLPEKIIWRICPECGTPINQDVPEEPEFNYRSAIWGPGSQPPLVFEDGDGRAANLSAIEPIAPPAMPAESHEALVEDAAPETVAQLSAPEPDAPSIAPGAPAMATIASDPIVRPIILKQPRVKPAATLKPDQILSDDGQPLARGLNAARLTDRSFDELIGLAKMAISDGILTRDEAEFLLKWFHTNPSAAQRWPGDILYQRLSSALADGEYRPSDQGELLDLLLDLTGADLEKFDFAGRSSKLPLDDPQPQIKFRGSTFCFTGKFNYGARSKCWDATVAQGGIIYDTVKVDLNYLVIGAIGSSDWIHSTHGRKIEKAIQYREAGRPLAIVSEEHWASCLQSSL